MSNRKKRKINLIGILCLTIALISLYLRLSDNSAPRLTFTILSNVEIINIEEETPSIKVVVDDVNLKEHKKNVSLIILKIQNQGSVAVGSSDYDFSIPFGLKTIDCELVSNPTIIKASNTDYFSDVIDTLYQDVILFKKKIFNKQDFFEIKYMVVNELGVKPKIVPLGKIANQDDISVINIENELQRTTYSNLKRFIMLTGFYAILFVALGVYFFNQLKKNKIKE